MHLAARTAVAFLAISAPLTAFAQNASFTVYNQSSWTVYHLHVSPSSSTAWGPDQLGTEVISTSGDSFTLQGVPCDTYDMKIIDQDDDVCVIKGIRMCGGAAAYTITSDNLLACIASSATAASAATYQPPAPNYQPPAPNYQPAAASSTVTVQNYSSWSIHYLYLSPSSTTSWGSDRLGEGRTIPADGGSFAMYSISCDTYDVRLVDEDGDECVMKGVRLCGANQTWTFTNDNLLACQAGN